MVQGDGVAKLAFSWFWRSCASQANTAVAVAATTPTPSRAQPVARRPGGGRGVVAGGESFERGLATAGAGERGRRGFGNRQLRWGCGRRHRGGQRFIRRVLTGAYPDVAAGRDFLVRTGLHLGAAEQGPFVIGSSGVVVARNRA